MAPASAFTPARHGADGPNAAARVPLSPTVPLGSGEAPALCKGPAALGLAHALLGNCQQNTAYAPGTTAAGLPQLLGLVSCSLSFSGAVAVLCFFSFFGLVLIPWGFFFAVTRASRGILDGGTG